MSEENINLVRDIHNEFATTHRAVERLITPDFVWDMGSFGGWPEKQKYTGPDGFDEFFATWTDPYAEWDFALDDIRALEHDRVLVILRQRGRLPQADSWVELHYGVIWTVTDGLLSRAQVFGTREQALKAVGLEE
jgi:hypothetical protein